MASLVASDTENLEKMPSLAAAGIVFLLLVWKLGCPASLQAGGPREKAGKGTDLEEWMSQDLDTPTESEANYYNNLTGVMYKTRGCRFSAAIALRVQDVLSMGTIAFLSIYILGLSIIALAYPEIFTSTHARFYTAVGALASAALLVISLMDFGFSRAVAAERLEQNALEVSSIMRAMERELASSQPMTSELKRLAETYEDLNRRTAINHTDADYRRWNLRCRLPQKGLDKALHWFLVVGDDIAFYGRAMIAHLALVTSIVLSNWWYTASFLIPSLGPG